MVAFQGDAGYQDAVDSADAIAKVWPDLYVCSRHSVAIAIFNWKLVLQLLNVSTDDILIQSTGVIGQRIKKVHQNMFCMNLSLRYSFPQCMIW